MNSVIAHEKMRCETRPYETRIGTIPGVVVATARSVSNATGAVNLCAQEYLRTLETAGFKLDIVTFEPDRRPLVRLKRKLRPRSYADIIPPYVAAEAAAVARKTAAGFVFLHMTDTAPLANSLRAALGPDVKLVLLSHGMESVDYLHKLRTQEDVSPIFQPRLRRSELARQLCLEAAQRRFIDHVLCLSPVETEIERWLGAKAVTWVPRTVTAHPLPWNPTPGRIGFVGALDHQPNTEGLLLFARALEKIAPKGLRLRVVGAPEKAGRRFAQTFRFIDYLGSLNDAQLELEAATWNCFANPIFCYPRGCSTKLGVGLGWQLPVVTTSAGARGYVWRTGELSVSDTPDGLAHLAAGMLDYETAVAARREVQHAGGSAPSLEEVAALVRGALLES